MTKELTKQELAKMVIAYPYLILSVTKGLELAKQVHGTGHGIQWDCTEEIELFTETLKLAGVEVKE